MCEPLTVIQTLHIPDLPINKRMNPMARGRTRARRVFRHLKAVLIVHGLDLQDFGLYMVCMHLVVLGECKPHLQSHGAFGFGNCSQSKSLRTSLERSNSLQYGQDSPCVLSYFL